MGRHLAFHQCKLFYFSLCLTLIHLYYFGFHLELINYFDAALYFYQCKFLWVLKYASLVFDDLYHFKRRLVILWPKFLPSYRLAQLVSNFHWKIEFRHKSSECRSLTDHLCFVVAKD